MNKHTLLVTLQFLTGLLLGGHTFAGDPLQEQLNLENQDQRNIDITEKVLAEVRLLVQYLQFIESKELAQKVLKKLTKFINPTPELYSVLSTELQIQIREEANPFKRKNLLKVLAEISYHNYKKIIPMEIAHLIKYFFEKSNDPNETQEVKIEAIKSLAKLAIVVDSQHFDFIRLQISNLYVTTRDSYFADGKENVRVLLSALGILETLTRNYEQTVAIVNYIGQDTQLAGTARRRAVLEAQKLIETMTFLGEHFSYHGENLDAHLAHPLLAIINSRVQTQSFARDLEIRLRNSLGVESSSLENLRRAR